MNDRTSDASTRNPGLSTVPQTKQDGLLSVARIAFGIVVAGGWLAGTLVLPLWGISVDTNVLGPPFGMVLSYYFGRPANGGS